MLSHSSQSLPFFLHLFQHFLRIAVFTIAKIGLIGTEMENRLLGWTEPPVGFAHPCANRSTAENDLLKQHIVFNEISCSFDETFAR